MKLTYTDELKPSLAATVIQIAEVSRAIWADYRWQVRTMRQARRIAEARSTGGATPDTDVLFVAAVVTTVLGATIGAVIVVASLAGWLQ